ncbi:hypothetical protein, partial [Ruminococcus callidus]
TPLFVSSDEKFDDASVAQSLCGIALRMLLQICTEKIVKVNQNLLTFPFLHDIIKENMPFFRHFV